jgi:hypothetical protein
MSRVRSWERAAGVVLLLWVASCADDDAHLFNGRDAAPGDGDGDGDGDADEDAGGDGDGDGDADGDGAVGDGDGDGDQPAELFIPDDCPVPPINTAPKTLRCAGLYKDVADKELSPGVREFKPAVELWSDGADKTRWIYLPPGTTIDVSKPDQWKFPVGTRLFKEFKWNGKRAETRLFWKARETRWERATYRWNDDETEATEFGGGEVEVGGESYVIPSNKECDQCHKGRVDRVLGFESVLLGLDGAEGVTLKMLAEEGLLSDDNYDTDVSLGDDGSGEAAAAMGWLHVNCGISCHNGSTTAEGFRTGMRLQLDVDQARGGSLAQADALATTIGVTATTLRWDDWERIVPGKPEESLVWWLLSMRNPSNRKDQMPPIASRVVDDDGAMLVEKWIRALGASDNGAENP